MDPLDRFANLSEDDLQRLAAGEAMVCAKRTAGICASSPHDGRFLAPGDHFGRIGTIAYTKYGPEAAAKVSEAFHTAYNITAHHYGIRTVDSHAFSETLSLGLDIDLKESRINEVREAFDQMVHSCDDD